MSGPVSYTHLDVYKRQVVNGQKAWNTLGQHADWIFCLVVSYTHLDVYKGQLWRLREVTETLLQ